MNIRDMRPEDAAAVAKLGEETPELKIDTGDGFWSEEQIRSWVAGGKDVLLVAEDEGMIVGARLTQVHHPSKTAVLMDMFVRSDYRSKGIGQAFMKETLSRLRAAGITYVYALSQITNERMHSFLEKQGFEKGNIPMLWFGRSL